MAEPYKIRKSAPRSPTLPRQRVIAFESSMIRSLTGPERLKAVTHLAHLLMLAAGIIAEEPGDER